MPARGPVSADPERAGSRIAVTRGQLKEGGRQTAASADDAIRGVSDGTTSDVGAGEMETSDDGRMQAPDAQHEISVLHDLPVLAAVPGSLQQSGTACTSPSTATDAIASCFMGHEFRKPCAIALP